MSRTAIASVVSLLAAASAAAEPTPVTPTVTVGGSIETYYQYSLARPRAGLAGLRLEPAHGAFTLAAATLDATATGDRWHGRVALATGATAAAVYATEPTPATWQLVREANAGAALGADVTVDAGLFLSPIGPEALASKDDWNWSRSTPFLALPAYHVGARATRPLGHGLTAQAWIVNGWNAAVDTNRWKSVMVAGTWADASTTAQILYAGGVERPTGAAAGAPWRHLVDAYATRALTDAIEVMAHADAGREDGADGGHRWLAGALYGRWRPSPALELAARVDGVHEWSDAGATPLLLGVEQLIAGTLTASWRAAPQLLVRGELRHDRASADVLPGRDGLRRDQTTATAAMTAWF
ncbi:MAG: outer membrane beta-barrel protein [Myxococcales bacterium]|nr:outer membrane beta-barrel protein [Myxococcales bacterium]